MPETMVGIAQRNWITTWAVDGHAYVIAWDQWTEQYVLSMDGLPITSGTTIPFLMGYAHGHYERNYGPNAG